MFFKGVPLKDKNGYHTSGKKKQEKKILNEKDKSVKEKNIMPECDEGNQLADLVYLAKRDLDDFSAPTFDDDELSLDDLGEDGLVLDAVEMTGKKISVPKTSPRYEYPIHILILLYV